MVNDPVLIHDIRVGMDRMFELLEQTDAVMIFIIYFQRTGSHILCGLVCFTEYSLSA